MAAIHLCPSDEVLRAVLLGSYAGSDAEDVSAHLLGCPACGSQAEMFAADDPLLKELRGAFDTGEGVADGTFVADVLRRVKEPQTGVSLPNAELAFLALPLPEFPEDLGMLDRYRVVKLIGEGGMGRVFEAIDPRLHRTVALKVILPKYAANAKLRDRFLEEARATVRCRSPRVAEVYEAGVWNDVPYLTMELLAGTTLAALPRPMPVDTWRPIARDIARGLADAHAVGIIHRDLKPGNIHLGTDPRTGERTVKLIDFGIARPVDRDVDVTKTGEILGTPAYMSPEQARAATRIDHRTDLYSLGVILHQLATGELPYDTTGGAFAILAHLATPEPLPSVRSRAPALPPAMVSLIDRLLVKDPGGRIATAEAVVKELSADTSGLTPTTLVFAETRPTEHAPSRPGRHPRRLWPVGIALALGLVGIGLAANGLPAQVVEERELLRQSPTPKSIVTIGTHDRRHRGEVLDMAASPALGLAALIGRSDGVKLWDTRTLTVKASCLPTIFGELPPTRVALLNGEWIAASHARKLYVLKVTGDRIDLHHARDCLAHESGEVHQIAASPDGNWLAVNRGKQVEFFTVDQLQKGETSTAVVPDVELRPSGPYLPPLFSRFTADSQSLGLITRAGVQFLTATKSRWGKGELIPFDENDVIASFAVDPRTGVVFVCSAGRNPKNPDMHDPTTTAIQRWERRDGRLVKTSFVTLPDSRSYPGRIELTPTVGLMLADGVSQATMFSYDGPPKILAWHYAPFGRPEALARVVSDTEVLACDDTLLRKFAPRGRDWKEVDPVLAEHNVLQADSGLTEAWQAGFSYFGTFGDRVMIVGREAGSPVRVWALGENGAKKLFERKSTNLVTLCQRAALSPNGNEVMIADNDGPPVVWGIDGKGTVRANTTFSEAARRHVPLGLTADGKFALTALHLDANAGQEFAVWDRTKLAAPVATFKLTPPVGDGYQHAAARVFTVKDGWRVLMPGTSQGAPFTDALDVQLTDGAVTFRKGTRLTTAVAAAVVRENLTLAGDGGPQPASHHWVLEDRGQTPTVETKIPLPADFRGRPGGIGVALAPGGNILAAYYYSGRTILFDRTTMKTVWDYQFLGGIMSLDFLGDAQHLMVVHRDGVVEVIDTTKPEGKK